MNRKKRPGVKPELRRKWYKLSEEEGESAVQISKAENYDVRTVRKQIEMEKQAREVREARSVVLRSALEDHYRDLCRCAEGVKSMLRSEKRLSVDLLGTDLPIDPYLAVSLRQHLPRSPIWNYLNQRNSLLQRISQLSQEAEKKIDETQSDPKLKKFGDRLPAVVLGLTAFFKFQFEQWSQGNPGLDLKENRVLQPLGDELFEFGYGAFHMGKVYKTELSVIDEVARDWQYRVKDFEELEKLKTAFDELARIDDKLSDELSIITLRRIVPGRCRYCPI